VLFRPGDAGDLAAKLIRLAEDPGRRQELGRRARAVAVERYTWEGTWAKALRGIVERHLGHLV
jgi:glycosyltransferase involved in cell wall biosynthesis